ncbi:FMN-binding protein [Spirochaeta cellobiosiphila]|uniref:FMN-binding protein n=1 Tax=Spirochaeta cellobiosiphila TaxID=504483 RepID=UPI0004175C71|nr:FMN-binding protein [Spirochaeta cellobiosiphila]
MNKEGTIYTIIFTFITAFLFVFLLALANEQTKDIIEINQEVTEKGSILSALGISTNDDNVLSTYETEVTEIENDPILYEAKVNNKDVYASKFSGPGLWGTITGVLAVDKSMDRIQGLEIISHSETPGLGGRISEDWFKKQFINQEIPSDLKLIINQGSGKGDSNKDDDRVDAITGATRTSDSLEALINQELMKLKKTLEVLK